MNIEYTLCTTNYLFTYMQNLAENLEDDATGAKDLKKVVAELADRYDKNEIINYSKGNVLYKTENELTETIKDAELIISYAKGVSDGADNVRYFIETLKDEP